MSLSSISSEELWSESGRLAKAGSEVQWGSSMVHDYFVDSRCSFFDLRIARKENTFFRLHMKRRLHH